MLIIELFLFLGYHLDSSHLINPEQNSFPWAAYINMLSYAYRWDNANRSKGTLFAVIDLSCLLFFMVSSLHLKYSSNHALCFSIITISSLFLSLVSKYLCGFLAILNLSSSMLVTWFLRYSYSIDYSLTVSPTLFLEIIESHSIAFPLMKIFFAKP